MKATQEEDDFKPYFEVLGTPEDEPIGFELPDGFWKLFLLTLGTLIPFSLALLPVAAGCIAGSLVLAGAIMIGLRFRGTMLEWGVLAAIGFVSIAIAMPLSPNTAQIEAQRRRQAHDEAQRQKPSVPPTPTQQ